MAHLFTRVNKFISLVGSGLFLAGELACFYGEDTLGSDLYLACAGAFLLYSITDWVEFETDTWYEDKHKQIEKEITTKSHVNVV
jgi:hypothetical protein